MVAALLSLALAAPSPLLPINDQQHDTRLEPQLQLDSQSDSLVPEPMRMEPTYIAGRDVLDDMTPELYAANEAHDVKHPNQVASFFEKTPE